MAKVYDALRRAEEQRRERAGQSQPEVAAPLPWEPSTEAPHKPRTARAAPFWKRWSAQRAAALTSEAAGEVNKRRIALLQPDSFIAEQFRSLRGRINAIAAERPIRSVAVTSALPGEGKTTAAINLAVVMAMQIEGRVALVDCDLRKPKVHRSLGLRPEAGLAEVLAGEWPLEKAVLPAEGVQLDVLAVRGQPPNPSELLATVRMRELLGELVARYDHVVLDTPAALSLPDAKTVSDLADAIVLVVRADATQQEEVEAALEILDARRVLGLVLNGARIPQGRYAYY